MEEHKVYFIFDKISPGLRALISALLIITGFLFQFASKNILAGLPFIIACVVLNFIKGISIKRVVPKSLKWCEVTPQKIDQVFEQCKRINKFRSGDIGCIVTGFVVFVMVLSFGIPLLSVIGSISFPVVATVVNLFILFGGMALSGRKAAWMPRALDVKTEVVKRMLDNPLIRSDPALQIIPYLEIGEDKKGSFPNDTRFLIKFKDAPDDFIGLQGQISINAVKGRNYPYFYVVLLAKPSFNLFEKFGKKTLDRCVIERKKTGEVDVIVIRQRTTKTSGYHTNPGMQDYILKHSLEFARELFK